MRRLRRVSIKTPEDGGGEHFETIVVGMGLGDDYASRELKTNFELVPSLCKPAQCASSQPCLLDTGGVGVQWDGRPFRTANDAETHTHAYARPLKSTKFDKRFCGLDSVTTI